MSTLTRRSFLKHAGFGATVLALAACAPSSSPAATSADAGAEGAASAAPIEVLLWHHLSASDGEVFDRLLDNFNEANDDIQIAYLMDSEVTTKIAASIAAGDPPDIGFRQINDVARWYIDGASLPLDDLMTGVELDLDDFNQTALDEQRINGDLLLIPMDITSGAALINLNHAEEAGLDPDNLPADDASLLEWSIAMTQHDSSGNVTRSGFLLTGSATQPNIVWGVIATQFGAQRISDDGQTVIFNDTDGPARAAQWILDAFDTHKISSRDVSDRYKAFGDQSASIFWTGPWTLNGYLNTDGLRFAVAPVSVVGEELKTWGGTSGLNIFTTQGRPTERIEAAAETVKWLSDNSFVWVTEGRGAPPRASILNDPAYQTTGAPWEYRKPFVDGIEYSFPDRGLPFPDGGQFGFYAGGDSSVPKAMDPVWAGDRSIEEGIAMLVEEWQQILDENNELMAG